MDELNKDVTNYNLGSYSDSTESKTYDLAQNEQLIGFYAYTAGNNTYFTNFGFMVRVKN